MWQQANDLRRRAEEATDRVMKRVEETGELDHLHGKPLNLDDDPDWLVTRVLKQQGFSHPLIELAKDLEPLREKAEKTVDRPRRRRKYLSDRSQLDAETVERFNNEREEALETYRSALQALNRAITDYHLQVPSALQRRPTRIDEAVAEAKAEIQPLAATQPPEKGSGILQQIRERLKPG